MTKITLTKCKELEKIIKEFEALKEEYEKLKALYQAGQLAKYCPTFAKFIEEKHPEFFNDEAMNKEKQKTTGLTREEMLRAIDQGRKVITNGAIGYWSSSDTTFNKDTLWDIVE